MIPSDARPAELLDAAGLRLEIERWSSHRREVDVVLAGYTARLSELSRATALAQGRSEKAAAFESHREVQKLTGLTRREATGLIEVGTLVAEPTEDRPWLAPVGAAVGELGVSIEKARIIQSGVGVPNDRVSAEDLLLAVSGLAEIAVDFTPEQLEAHTRAVREELDQQFIVDEEQRIHEARSARFTRRRDGSASLFVNFDRDGATIFGELMRNTLGPRTGGPRFVSESDTAYEKAIIDDPRHDEQLAHDAFVAVIRMGLTAGDQRMPGRAPAVRVTVTAHDLMSRTGYGVLEDGTPITIPAVEAQMCDAGYVEIRVNDSGKPLDHGYEKRLFTEAQRAALAVRDGGCRNPECDRPPGMCEAHHADEWVADRGTTDLENGILLCKRDHLDLHNRGAKIEYERERDMYVCVELDGTRRDWPTKSRIQARIKLAVTRAA